MVPRRGSSLSRADFERPCLERPSRSGCVGGFLTELARPVIGAGLVGGDVWVAVAIGLTGWSWSGGGVGGNMMLRLIGGSDCCLVLLRISGFTRFEAAKEMFSGGRSSRLKSRATAMFLFISGPAKPVDVLVLSDDAINRAFPR